MKTIPRLVAAVAVIVALVAPALRAQQQQTPSEAAALQAFRQGEFIRAVELYTTALTETDDPVQRGRLHVQIAWTLFALAREGEATSHLQAALLEDPGLQLDTTYYTQEFIDLFERARAPIGGRPIGGGVVPDLEITLATITEKLHSRNDLEGALVDVDHLIAAYPADSRLVPLKVELLQALGRIDEADQLLSGYGDSFSPEMLVARLSVPDLIMRANRLLDDGDVTGALDILRRAVSRQPNSVAALELMADAAQRSARWQEAEFALKSALSLQPDNIGIKLSLGEVYLARGDVSAARDVFRQITEKYPHSDRAWAALGLLDARLGNDDRAVPALKQALVENPLLPEVQLAYGEILLKNGNAQAALEAFQEAENLLQGDLQLKARKGQALIALGRQEQALPLLKAAVDGDFRPFDVQRSLIQAMIANGDLAAAERLLVSAAVDERRETDILKATLHIEQGKLPEAETSLRSILGARPNDPGVINLLAAAIYRQRRFADALGLLEQAATLAPENAVIKGNLARAKAARDAEILAEQAKSTRNRMTS